MCRWITGIAMGWLGLVTQCFAGMGEKQKKPTKAIIKVSLLFLGKQSLQTTQRIKRVPWLALA